MAAIPRDEEISSLWVWAHLCCRMRSSPSLTLDGVGVPNVYRPKLPRRRAFECFGNRRNVFGRIAAAAAGNIYQSSPREVAQIAGHVLRPQIEPGFREGIRQASVRVARDRHVRLLRKFL